MPRATANKLYKNFTGGLITEASPLTYPENASIDEDNTVILRKGNRRRRLGIEYLSNYSASSYGVTDTEKQSHVLNEFVWQSVGQDPDVNFLVLQVGDTLHFWDISDSTQYPSEKSFTIDLSTNFLSGAPTTAPQSDVSMAAGEGLLFVSGRYTEPFYVQYDPDLDIVNKFNIQVLMRDFEGVDDGLAIDEEPTTLSTQHKYNLLNQGWSDPKRTSTVTASNVTYSGELTSVANHIDTNTLINSYNSINSRYPSNAQTWWYSKDSSGDFDPAGLEKLYFGASKAPRGRFILNAFNQDRDAASGLSGIPDVVSNTRPNAISFFAGRVFYAHESFIYFSQVLERPQQAGQCFQEADPSSELISDLLPTDGGRIPIPEAIDIQAIRAFSGTMMVFASNGVWAVSGTEAGFTALDYSVTKLSSVGIEGKYSIVEAGARMYWWSKIGIQGVEQQSGFFGPVSGSFSINNLTQDTIQTFFNQIPGSSRRFVKGVYDPTSDTVQWIFNSGTANGTYLYTRVLSYDLTLNAFYPWTISADDSGTELGPYLCGIYIAQDVNETRTNRLIRYIALVPNTGNTQNNHYFCEFSSFTFGDWATYQGESGYAYESFMSSGYELFDDAMRDKHIGYLVSYFQKTETNYVSDGGDGYTSDFPSSCKVQVRWDWSDSDVSGKYTEAVEAYRHDSLPPVDPSDLTFNSGSTLVSSKLKMKGAGRAIQFRYSSSELNADFNLLGWAVSVSGNTNV